MNDELDYMTVKTDEQIVLDEQRAIAEAIKALQAVAHAHGFSEDGMFDPDWMDNLDVMINHLRQRDADCYRALRHLNKLAVPATSH